MVQLTGHATYCIQPPDRSFFSPLKAYCTQAADKWLSTNSGMKVTQFHVDDLVTEAYGRAATVENAIGGFRMTWNMAAENFNQKDAPLSQALPAGVTPPISIATAENCFFPTVAIRRLVEQLRRNGPLQPLSGCN
ncbi:hypothetical protein J6590_021415 [Homalodisca vitripennis]|nr:hypothetical protein J6590_036867 [Homalodisca vitripennis]KAG8268598.1 hypothetical protein J6590_021415 [Homalodisca vitripennis]